MTTKPNSPADDQNSPADDQVAFNEPHPDPRTQVPGSAQMEEAWEAVQGVTIIDDDGNVLAHLGGPPSQVSTAAEGRPTQEEDDALKKLLREAVVTGETVADGSALAWPPKED